MKSRSGTEFSGAQQKFLAERSFSISLRKLRENVGFHVVFLHTVPFCLFVMSCELCLP